jgi:valyl-tRNA synthetase
MEPKLKDKRWRHELEEAMVEKWKRENWWKFDTKSKKPVVVFDTPPAYPAPFWHLGAGVSYGFQDMIARAYRMSGYNVLFPMCFDNNGIPVEWYVEKYEGVNMRKYPRDKFIELCSRALDKYIFRMENIMRRMMIAADYEENRYLTDSDEYRKLTQSTFISLYKKGLIYLDDRPNNWCPRCQTTIADAETSYKDVDSNIWNLKFKIKETGEDLIIATTRPELVGACGAVIVNPEDDRYKGIVGKTAVVPHYNAEVPVVSRKEADMGFGTGVVMICSYGDKTDVQLFKEMSLEPKKMIGTDGKMTKDSGFEGMGILEAREKLVSDLKKGGMVLDSKPYKHKIPTHERCETPIEIIPMQEYYLKQVDFKEDMVKIAKGMVFHPEKHRQRLLDWVGAISIDWPISRRRYYATEIPLWYCNCGYVHVPEPGKYYRPWKEQPDVSCPNCGSPVWKGEERTLDTWMDSSISILYLTRYMRDDDFFKKTFENGLKIRPQGYEIIRTWLYYSLLRVYQLMKKPAFQEAMINGMGIDEKGLKMSKSMGNIVLPEDIIKSYGADAIRFWSTTETSFGEDYRISESRILGAYKFLTKLWNIARFVSMFPNPEKPKELKPSDQWILAEVSDFKRKCIGWYKDVNLLSIGREAMNVMWNKFASNYIEMVKWRAKDGDKAASWTLHKVLKEFLLTMAPIIPGITDYIWRHIYNKESIHSLEFGDYKSFLLKKKLEQGEKLMEFNSYVWKKKKQEGIRMKEGIKVKVPQELKEFSLDLKKMHNLL